MKRGGFHSKKIVFVIQKNFCNDLPISLNKFAIMGEQGKSEKDFEPQCFRVKGCAESRRCISIM
jgi:hypothetical protein